MATHELIEVVLQLGPLNASIKALAVVKLLPPAAISVMTISTAVQPAGVVKVYHRSYLVPVQAPVIPELVARYKVPDVVTHVVFGVSEAGAAQSSFDAGCANKNFEPIIDRKNRMPVRAAVIGDMVFQGF
jgi:hypothetical protein